MSTSPPPDCPITLAEGGLGDLDAVMAIMTAAFDPHYGEAWTRSQCAGILPMSGVSLLVARDGDEFESLGFALCRTVAGEAELLLLAVAPERRRRGIGRRLLDTFVDRARSRGARRVHLEMRDGNPAIHMYRSAGFSPAGRRRRYYRGKDGSEFDAITLSREL